MGFERSVVVCFEDAHSEWRDLQLSTDGDTPQCFCFCFIYHRRMEKMEKKGSEAKSRVACR